ncbi:uncharacterized protein LOC132312961 [Cornus florida]|uniref:uncharacterized protein LOC132312959 n=1 Tax=Cornus florida TaxID=4283 RepID=UPI002897B533|nr:uncharacterized protein LOC132312959 [Cornus florida]XP_059667517.1 uncharacterized protein LOC132312961 [Cornus florida]
MDGKKYLLKSSDDYAYDLIHEPGSPVSKKRKTSDAGVILTNTPPQGVEAGLQNPRSRLATTPNEKALKPFPNNGKAPDQRNNQEGQRFSKWPTMRRILNDFKKTMEPSLRTLLEELSKNDLDMEHCLEIADSANVLSLFRFSNPQFEDFFNKAGNGEKKLREGLMQVKEGHELLRSAVKGMLKSSL